MLFCFHILFRGHDFGSDCVSSLSSLAFRARVFFIFRFTDPPDPIFWKLKKKNNKRDVFFNFIFLFPSDSCKYSTGVQLCFFCFVFSIDARLIKLPPVPALGEILPF